MVERGLPDQGGRRVREGRLPRLGSAHVEEPRLVMILALREERAPVDRPEQGPDRDGADVGAFLARTVCAACQTSMSQRSCSSRVQP